MDALVTGGAGFIGSHLVTALLESGHTVRVLDDLSTGRIENVPSRASLLTGNVADPGTVADASDGIEVVFHLAADGSVAHSVDDPLETDRRNVAGTLTVLDRARAAGVRRVVFASSCSVYGSVGTPPLAETDAVAPLSPYAVTKLAGEHYCRVFAQTMGLETVSLRFFNVFGPGQRADSSYAAAIPRFASALLSGARPTIFGDGRQRRDFVFVGDVVTANLLAATAPTNAVSGEIFNVGGGRSVDLLELLETMGRILNIAVEPKYEPARTGDVRESEADLNRSRRELGFNPSVPLEEGLRRLFVYASSR